MICGAAAARLHQTAARGRDAARRQGAARAVAHAARAAPRAGALEAPARAPSPAQPFDFAVDDTTGRAAARPFISTQVTPLEEEPDVIQQNSRSLPILLEETPPQLPQRSHSAPGTDTTRHYVDSQSPRNGLLAGHALVFAIGSGLNKPQAETLALKVKVHAGRLVKGA